MNLVAAIPHIAGGAIMSSAIALDYRYRQKTTESHSSLYNILTLDSQTKWRSSFVAGMLFIATLIASIFGFEEVGNTSIKPFESDKLFFKGTPLIQFMFAGLLIGLGTRLAKQGISRYGFYGIPRFNGPTLLSMLAVLLFASITATLRSEFSILHGLNISKKFNEHLDFRLSFLIPLFILGINLLRAYQDTSAIRDIMRSFGIGGLLSLGMMMAGLGRRHQVLDFLSLNKNWSPFYLFVLFGAFLANIFLFNLLSPQREGREMEPESLNKRTLLGCSLFGIGLGISGLTPGSGLMVSSIYLPQIALFFLPFIVLGQLGAGFIETIFMGKSKNIKAQ